MEEGNLAVLVDAKTEYTKQLVNILKHNIYMCFQKILNDLKKESRYNLLKKFQDKLSLIPKWNQDIIDNQFNIILENSNCDWLDELITAVFVSRTFFDCTMRQKKLDQLSI